MSLSGPFAVQGRQTLAGIQAWVEDVNAGGGLRVGEEQPKPVELVHYDDAGQRDRVKTATERLIVDDRVDLLVGPYSAVMTLAAAEVAESRGKLMWNQGGASPNVYWQGYKWVVGILSPATSYLSELLYAVRQSHPNACSLLMARASRGAFPRDVCAGVEEQASALDFRIVESLRFDPESEDFSGIVESARETGPDVFVAVGRFQDDLRLARQLAESGTGLTAAAVVAAGVHQFGEQLGGLAEGFIGPSQWEAEAGYAADYGPSAEQVVASLHHAGHRDVDYPMAQAYAAGVVIQRCLLEAGSLDDAALRQAAATLDFTTFFGRFRIDPETGLQTGRSTLLVQWKDGRKVVVWPPESATGALRCPWRM